MTHDPQRDEPRGDTHDVGSEPFVLSAAQRSILFAQHLLGSVPLSIAQYVDLRGDLDFELLRRVGTRAAHEFGTALLRLVPGDPDPLQVVDHGLLDEMRFRDLRGEADPEATAHAWMRADTAAPLDLFEDRLIEATMLQIADDRWFWYCRMHHVALDGYGAMAQMTRAIELYNAEWEGLPAPVSRAGALEAIVADEHAYRASSRFTRDREHWRSRVRDLPVPVRVSDRVAPPAACPLTVGRALPPDLAAALDETAAAQRTTLAALVVAATALYLSVVCDTEDVTLSLPVSARTNALLRRSGGMVSNVVPLRLHIGPDTTVGELLAATTVELTGALRHQRYRAEDMHRDSPDAPAFTDPGSRGFFGPAVNLMMFHPEVALGAATGRFHVLSTGPVDDLAVNVYPSIGGSESRIDLEANPALHTEAELDGRLDRLFALLSDLAGPADRPARALRMVRPEEHAALVPAHGPEAPDRATLAEIFAATVARHDLRPALRQNGDDVSYRELDERANRLARMLIARGVGPEVFVAVSLPRGVRAVVATLAIAKAGGAFVPVDPALPSDRIRTILEDCSAGIGLTDTDHVASLPASVSWLALGAETLRDEYLASSPAPLTRTELRGRPRTDAAAYMIYTSGSTGVPKGVVVPHAGLAAFAAEQRRRYQLPPEARTLQFASASFDASVLELLLAVGAGACAVTVPQDVYGGDALTNFLRAERITHAFLTPAALATVDETAVPDLRTVIVGGDACEAELVRRWAPGRRMFNAYGPTECTVMATGVGPMSADEPVTIGDPGTGIRVVVLDSRLRPVPVGAPGELYIAGPAVSRGYHRRPAQSAAAFVADPYGPPGSRMYRTGDRVRWDDAHRLHYLGRTDFQVKLRGFRIEPGEIDAVLGTHPAVDFAVTVTRRRTDRNDTLALVSYVLPARDSSTAPADLAAALREHAARSLPHHMVPAAVTVLDELPLTTAGKVDRRALPEPDWPHEEFIAPTSETETLVADVFRSVLGADTVGAHDNFFSLGGNSLSATRVAAELGAALGTTVAVRTVFEAATVSALARRLDETQDDPARPPLVPVPRDTPVPVSPAQHRMWFLNRFDGASPAYNIPIALRIRGQLDTGALAAAFDDVSRRHEILRTSYPDSPDGPIQLVHPEPVFAPVLADIAEDALPDRLREIAATRFDVTSEVPVRAEILRLAPEDHVVAVTLHHISADGASLAPFARDTAIAYAARSGGRTPEFVPLPIQFADVTVWQDLLLGDESDPRSVAARQLEYWRNRLAGLPPRLDLPTDRPRPTVASMRGGTVDSGIDVETFAAVRRLAADTGTTPFMVVQAVFAVLLARLSTRTDIAVGTPVAGRVDPALDDLIGMFVGTLVLRTEVRPGERFRDLLERVRRDDTEDFAHADLPFERLVDALAPTRSAAHHPLVQVGFSYQNLPSTDLKLAGLDAEVLDLPLGVAKFDLHLTAVEDVLDSTRTHLRLQWDHALDLFDADTVRMTAERFEIVLREVLAHPDTVVGDIDLRTAAGSRIAARLDGDRTDLPSVTLPELLADQWSRSPHAPALVFDDHSLDYAGFASRVVALAQRLIETGVRPETRVAVALRRGLDLPVALCAVLVAGGAYVPIDPDAPGERTAHILRSARPACVVTTSDVAASLPGDLPVVDVDTEGVAEAVPAPVIPETGLRPGNTAYVLYTSGSTGVPKGVAVSHAAVAAQLRWKKAEFPISVGDTVMLKTPVGFDLSVWELFWPLISGARLAVAHPDDHRDPARVARALRRYGVTTAHFVPSLLDALLTVPGALDETSLQRILCIGEALTPGTVERVRSSTDAEMFNLYGPTEAAVSVTSYRCSEREATTVPIGLPVWDTDLLVLDARLHPVPVGVVGELYLAGPQLASWYEGRPDLTAERFVARPSVARTLDGTAPPVGDRMYRTGDLVRFGKDGTLEYVGRNDFQVKLRGQRIELGEVEAALTLDDRIAQAVAAVHRDTLVAYVVPADLPGALPVDDVLADLSRRLPGYMVPATLDVLPALPMNVNGKIDRAALPEPTLRLRTYRVPETELEQAVVGAIAAVLGIDEHGLGTDDDFFAVGGNSLSATRVTARLSEELDVDVPVRALFEAPTVRALAAWIDGVRGRSARRPALTAGPRPERVPLNAAQYRMWLLNQLDPSSPAYNLPVALRLDGGLDLDALAAAWRDVQTRHESLRTRYPDSAGVPEQVVVAPEDLPAPSFTPVDIDTTDLQAEILAAAAAGFDVTAGIPVRTRLLRVAPDSHVLVVVAHHIAADGSSLAPLARDIALAYAARSTGDAPHWEPLAVQVADHAVWQQRLLADSTRLDAETAFWRETLHGLPPLLELPTDHPRPVAPSGRGVATRFTIDAGLHSAARELAQRHGATLFMVVHAAFAVALAHWGSASDVAVGTPVAGRGSAVLDEVVGMFADTLVLRTPVDPSSTFAELLGEVRQRDLAAFDHAEVPFEHLVTELDPPRSADRHPFFQVMLAFQDAVATSAELPGLRVSAVDLDLPVARFDLHLTLTVGAADQPVEAHLSGSADLFDAATVATLSRRFTAILRHLVETPETPIGAVDAGETGELDRLAAWGTGETVPLDARSLPDLLAARIAAEPAAPALTEDDGTTLSYGEFGERVARLAHHLLAAGAGPERIVAVALPRSADFVVAVHAVVAAGGAYLPVDPAYPAARIRELFTAATPVAVLTTPEQTTVVAEAADAGIRVVDPADAITGDVALPTDADRPSPLHPDHPAYVIFTSGSTGRPKGVTVTHRAIVNRLRWMQHTYPLSVSDTVLHKTPATFDVSVWELFWPLQVGARLLVAAPDGHRDPRYLGDLVDREDVTVAHFVPSMLDAFVAGRPGDGAAHPSLRTVFTSGEGLRAETATALLAACGTELHNLYGPTEAAVDVTHRAVVPGSTVPGTIVPIGLPVWNTGTRVLDARLRPVPEGVRGELYLTGIQLARGYLGRPDLTADRFVADPDGPPGSRMYRTGDVVRWRSGPDGTDPRLDFLGRSDFQIKLRGQRIELGEIEAVLLTRPDVAAAVCVLRHHPVTGDHLVAYAVPAGSAALDGDALRVDLAAALPAHLVPSAVAILDALPVGPNGKLDRAALPEARPETGSAGREPATVTERRIAEIFARELGLDRVDPDRSFLDLGGNSLVATRLVAAIDAVFPTGLRLREIFESPSVAALAARIDSTALTDALPLAPMPRPERVPLSAAQQRMWLLQNLDPASSAYTIAAALRIDGPLDTGLMRAALADVSDRHEILRTVYAVTDGQPHQVVLPTGTAVADLEVDESGPDDPAEVFAVLRTGFDLAERPPLRIGLRPLGPDSALLVVAVHHIAADGWSLRVLAADLLAAYAARAAGHRPDWDPLPVQYADYTLWQQAVLGNPGDPGSRLSRELAFWRTTLTGAPALPDLPTDRPRPATATGRGARAATVLDADTHRALDALAREHGATLFMVAHTALAVLLSRLGAGPDIVIGAPVAGRHHPALAPLVGMFVQTVVLRTPVDTRRSFDRLLGSVRASDLAAFDHDTVPFETVVETLAPPRSTAHHPLFQITLTVADPAPIDEKGVEAAGFTVHEVPFDAGVTRFDLEFTLTPRPDGSAGIDLIYATDLFDAATADTLLARFATVLRSAAEDPTLPVRSIDLSTPAENAALERLHTRPPVPERSLADLLTGAGRAEDTALVAPGPVRVELTYGQLGDRANRLARLLIGRGLDPGDVVAICLPRSVDQVVAVWATALAGATFVPVDPDYPAGRIAHMLGDSGARLCLTTTDRLTALAAIRPEGPWLTLDDAGARTELASCEGGPVTDAERSRALSLDDPAYMIYTSGSTGLPKAVVVTHRGLAAFAAEQTGRYRVDRTCRSALFASPSFDASILELLLAFAAGASTVVVPTGVYGGTTLGDVLRDEHVTHLFLTPGALRTLDPDDLPEVHTVIVGGDECPPSLVREWAPGRRMFNAYGPTESTIMATVAGPLSPDGEAVPIGVPVTGTRVQVLDDAFGAVPPGSIGELYLAGPGLARGYHGRPGLTATTFVADPDGPPGSRRYRTGDLVRWDRDGSALSYAGRRDNQVKVRGFRIELGEVERALRAHPDVEFALALGHRVDPGSPDSTVLVAYVGTVDGRTVPQDVLLAHARAQLPGHMVPAAITELDRIPLTPAGKLDRDALPEPQFAPAEYTAPRSATEQVVTEVFAEILGADRVGVHDAFFDRGGNSLTATRAVARINDALGAGLEVRDLFEAPTAALLAVRAEIRGPARAALTVAERPDRIPLSLAQQRMWFLNRFDAGSAVENIPVVLWLRGPLDVQALRAAVGDLTARHEILRMSYPDSPDGPHQLIAPVDDSTPELVVDTVPEDQVSARVMEAALAGFDVTAAPPIRLVLLRVSDRADEHVLALVSHHICADGVSMGVLARDTMTAYAARCTGEPPAWSPLGLQYADFALWQRDVLGDDTDPESIAGRQRTYWSERLAGLPDVLDLPSDRPRPAVQSHRGRRHDFTLDADLHEAMRRRAAELGATPFMVAHAALAILLARLSGTRDIVVGTPIAGRGDRRLDDVVGMFVGTLVLRTEIAPGADGRSVVAAVRDGDLAAFGHADLPFERLVEILNPPRSQAHHPLFQVALSFQNLGPMSFALPGLDVEVVDPDLHLAEFDLHLTLVDDGSGGPLPAQIVYATDLFDEDTVAGIAAGYTRILRGLVDDPGVAVGDLPLTDAADLPALTAPPSVPLPLAHTVLTAGFVERARQCPDAVAVVEPGPDGARTLTYTELLGRVTALARTLVADGVGPDVPVAVVMGRSIEQVVAMYAVVEAGGAYVPVDPSLPDERIGHILATARPPVVLIDPGRTLPGSVAGAARVVPVGTADPAGAAAPLTDAERRGPVRDDNAAYVIFTSGSTGVPKGVAVPHRAVIHELEWMQRTYALTGDDAVLVKASAGFDLSVWEYWWALRTGARIVLAPAHVPADPAALAELIGRERVTTLTTVPSMLEGLVDQPVFPGSLRRILCIGEELAPALAERALAVTDAGIDNLYGPTEAAVSVTRHPVTGRPDRRVPIGRAQTGVGTYVLDERLHPVPDGVTGELYLSGIQLARGYTARPDLTASRFVASPFEPGERLYRTGDLVRSRNGVLEYLGRGDLQLKLRGHRIEIGEIEAVLGRAPGVDLAAVTVADPERATARLVAFVEGTAVDPAAVTAHARSVLPGYMTPSQVVVVESLPRNANGKLDRARLPEPPRPESARVAPRTDLEATVASVIGGVLGIADLGVTDDFFALGGNSLTAVRVAARLREELGREIPVRLVFEAPTVAELAARIPAAGAATRIPLGPRPHEQEFPLAPAQMRIWAANRADPNGDWNIPVALRLVGEIDPDVLCAAATDVVARHEMLRTRFRDDSSGPVQWVVPVEDVSVVPAVVPVTENELPTVLDEFLWAPYDLTVDIPLRMRLFRLSADEHVLALVVHHIAADGRAMLPLSRDVLAAYLFRAAGQEPQWPPQGVQYGDYAVWKHEVLGEKDDPDSEYARQLGYWTTTLDRSGPRPALRTDRPRPERWNSLGDTVSFELGADVHAGLLEAAQRLGASLFMVLQAAFAVQLRERAESDDVTVATANAGRDDPLLDDVVGNFADDLVLRLRIGADTPFSEVVAQVRRRLHEAMAHPDISAPVLLEALGVEPTVDGNPLFPATLILQRAEVSRNVELPGLSARPEPFDNRIAKHELEIALNEYVDENGVPEGLTGTLIYPTALFERTTIVELVENFRSVLEDVSAGRDRQVEGTQ
ncbi:amino acid adenylation domain-containing protein [Rhodococcus sp. Z13]|uniref:Amino acid adenylation domain-containing protein n=1 Tax=Rhodococcus sacchari TaxID=2962047 RepID=A0ACD4DI60_9NOCA|nr:non-ribosomal peptide synthetase [Rhodococcus sp. Z13]UYP19739.1 amino acid adenylation domain-containing protein [Rhodococcus sp. Z13]